MCEIGTNPIAKDHVLTVEVRTKFPVRNVEKTIPNNVDVLNMRHVGPLHFRVPEGLTIEMFPESDPIAVWKCIGEDPLDFVNGIGRWDEDFRWILNLEGTHFHNQELRPSVFGTQHVVKLQQGEYFFRTAFRSPGDLTYSRTRDGEDPLEFRRIGAVARASAYFAPDQVMRLTWNDGSQERVLELPRPLPNVTYEIYFQNTPLYQEVTDPADLSEFEELQHYYNVIPTVEESSRFKLEPRNDSLATNTGTPTIPCQVMRLDWPDTD
jgi:hypothetical protein